MPEYDCNLQYPIAPTINEGDKHMNHETDQPQQNHDTDAQQTERRQGRERRTRTDVAYQYEITLAPKPERRESGERREKQE